MEESINDSSITFIRSMGDLIGEYEVLTSIPAAASNDEIDDTLYILLQNEAAGTYGQTNVKEGPGEVEYPWHGRIFLWHRLIQIVTVNRGIRRSSSQ